MDKPHVYFGLMLNALRMEGHHIPLSDEQAAQMIADALDILDPDNATPLGEATPYLAESFHILAGDCREAEELSS